MADVPELHRIVSAALQRGIEDLRARGVLLVGISGRLEHGKNEVANALGELVRDRVLPHECRSCEMAFAGSLKEATAAMFGFTDAQMHTAAGKAAIDSRWGLSPRIVLQQLGTEGVRALFGPDFWAASLIMRIPPGVGIVFITDVRFPNEADMIRAAGGILVRVVRPYSDTFPAPVGPEHASETALDRYDFAEHELLHNDNTLPALYAMVAVQLEPRVVEALPNCCLTQRCRERYNRVGGARGHA